MTSEASSCTATEKIGAANESTSQNYSNSILGNRIPSGYKRKVKMCVWQLDVTKYAHAEM